MDRWEFLPYQVGLLDWRVKLLAANVGPGVYVVADHTPCSRPQDFDAAAAEDSLEPHPPMRLKVAADFAVQSTQLILPHRFG